LLMYFHQSPPIAFWERGTAGKNCGHHGVSTLIVISYIHLYGLLAGLPLRLPSWDHYDQTTIINRHFTVHVSHERYVYPNSCLDTD
jgi:hypothetical protein